MTAITPSADDATTADDGMATTTRNDDDDDDERGKRGPSSSGDDDDGASTTESSSSSSSSSSSPPAEDVEVDDGGDDDDAGSSRLFQPHRSLGLLTACSSPRFVGGRSSPPPPLLRSNFGKFHLQSRSQSGSDDSFLTVPIGDRFQILSLSKLVPVLVSRALPPSARHHRHHPRGGSSGSSSRRIRSRRNGGGGGGGGDGGGGGEEAGEGGGGDEEEAHRALSDSSMSVTVVTHGPRSAGGGAVSVTLFSRTRPISTLDAFPFLLRSRRRRGRGGEEAVAGSGGGGRAAPPPPPRWGIADVIDLGKHRVEMTGEKDGKMENALLFALVCARGGGTGATGGGGGADARRRRRRGGGTDGGGDDDGGGGVSVVGEDSSDDDDDDDDDGSSDPHVPPDDASDGDGGVGDGDDGDDADSPEDDDDDDGPAERRAPPEGCHGRVLLVQASRTSLRIIKVVDLDGVVGSGFVPRVGLHPATYVNKILLGGRRLLPAAGGGGGGIGGAATSASMLLLNVRSGKIIHSFGCLDSAMRGDGEERRGPAAATVTAMTQSPAVDTVAVGTSDGSVHLVNLLHDVELFSLRHGRPARHRRGKKASSSSSSTVDDDGANAVSSISFRTDGNATRMGVAPVAVGCDDGSVSVWDLTPVEDGATGIPRRTLLTRMEGAHHGGICKLEYLPGEPLLLSTGLSSNSIVLHVFDAPDHTGRVLRQRRGHTSPPRLLRYLHPGLSGGGILANAADGTDASSCQILSCGGPGDLTLRLFSTARSNLDREYSQGPGLEKRAKKFGKVGPEGRAELLLPEVAALVTSEARSRDWGDLVTIHRDHAMAYVWSTRRGCQTGMPVLRQPHWNISAMKDRPPRSANATSLAISACGNFALVGTLGGVVYKYNLQSGLARGSYPRDATSLTAEEERMRSRGLKFAGDVGRTMRMLEKNARRGGTMPSDMDQAERDRSNYLDAEARRAAIVGRASHDDAVVGIAIDSLNKTVVTAGADSKLVLWNFVTHMPHKKSPIMLPSPATKLTHVRDSDLAAIAMSDFGVVVFDCSTLTIVRYFGGSRYNKLSSPKDPRMGHASLITDLQFGPDGRRLFTSSFDGTIRVWDVPTGLCVDWMTFSSPPTSLTLSPTGEFLATSHVGRLGISLWCDKSFFRMVLLDGTPNRPSKMNEPCPVAECEQEGASDAINHAVPSILAKKDDLRYDDPCDENETNDGLPPQAKELGLITLSGLPPAHWKNLFHLELVKERNKPTEAPQKPPSAPFFLQWRTGLESGIADTSVDDKNIGKDSADDNKISKDPADGWNAVWSDDDAEDMSVADNTDVNEMQSSHENPSDATTPNKRRRVAHDRSKLADLLQNCFDAREVSSMGEKYSEVTCYLAKMGPSSIDVEISSLCYGIHDLEEGLPLLHIASMWLLEACESHQSFEAVNAYLHRFLHVHGNVITRMDSILQDGHDSSEEQDGDDPQRLKLKVFVQTIKQLQIKQKEASNRLQGKMQHTTCLLRHLSRMV